MRLLIDDAHVDLIKKAYEFYPIAGVTTNPTILSKIGGNPFDVLREIRRIIDDGELHVQAVSRKAEDIVEEAKHIVNIIGETTRVKIPAIPEGFKAMKILSSTTGILLTATAVYTPMQAYIAAECGASYVAPYVNRIDNMGFNGIEITKQIQEILTNNNMETEVIAASFKNSQQVLELCEAGIAAATVSPELMDTFTKNPAIYNAVDNFISDFESFAGNNNTMMNFR